FSKNARSRNVAWSYHTLLEHDSLLLPAVITPIWSLMSPRADTAGAHLLHSATASPSRSLPPVAVSQETVDACSGQAQRALLSGALCSTSPGHPVPGGMAGGLATVHRPARV